MRIILTSRPYCPRGEETAELKDRL